VLPELVSMARSARSTAGFKISEKRVVLIVAQHPGDFEELLTDLTTIGCEELLHWV
jgi:hypothetical protein